MQTGKLFVKILLGVGLWSFSLPNIVFAAGWISGGAGEITDEGNPWFLGSHKPIDYCVAVDPNFPLSTATVQKLIWESFREWKQVLQGYGLDRPDLIGPFQDGEKRGLALNVRQVEKCDDPEHQLRFKIGIVDEEMEGFFKIHTRSIVGVAHRRDYDHQTFRTGGFIWVAPQGWIPQTQLRGSLPEGVAGFPDWEQDNHFKTILLHEIGHVFGFPHLDYTIMREDIFEHLWVDLSSMEPIELNREIETTAIRMSPFFSAEPLQGDSRFPLLCSLFWDLLGHLPPSPRGPTEQCQETYELRYDPDKSPPESIVFRVQSLASGRQFRISGTVVSGQELRSTRLVKRLSFFSSKLIDKRQILLPLVDGANDTLEGYFQFLGKRYLFRVVFGHTYVQILAPGDVWWRTQEIKRK